MARDNRDSACSPCMRSEMMPSRGRPPDVGPGFWRTAVVAAALAEHHIGHVIRAYREHPYHVARIAQVTMARWLAVSQPSLSRMETGQPVTDLETLSHIARVLGIPSGLLWFSVPDAADGSDGGPGMDRISGERIPGILGASGLASVADAGQAPPPGDLTCPESFPMSADVLAAEQAGEACDPESAELLAAELPHYARAVNMFGARPLTGLIERHVRLLYSGYEAARGPRRLAILDTCAGYAEFLGWLHQDLGRPVYGLFWTDRALEWAQEAGSDPQFVSYVVMRKSDHAEQYGTGQRVVALARAALGFPALSPRAQALVAQQEARGYAQTGDRPRFERNLDKARGLVQRAGAGDVPWGEYCDLTHLAMQEASGWIELREPEKAIPIIERELPRMAAHDRLDFGVFRSRLARAYAEAGYADRAASTGLAACASARATASARAFAELARVRRILGDGQGGADSAEFVAAFDALAAEVSASTRRVR